MKPFTWAVPRDVPEALGQFGDRSAYLAGGTTLVDLMKLEVMTPRDVLDIGYRCGGSAPRAAGCTSARWSG